MASNRTAQVATLVLAAVAGCSSRSGSQAGGPQPPPEVVVAKPAVVQTLDWDPYTGRLAAVESVDVRSRVEGYLVSHHFEEGKPVEKGQLLFRIDPRPFEAKLQEAIAQRAEALAKREQASSEVEVAQANAKQVEARLRLATAQLNRARPLAPRGAISEDELDELEAAYSQADADLTAAGSKIKSAQAAVTAAEAAYETAQAAVDSARLDLEYCDITAPISGRAGQRLVTEGNLVTGGALASPLTTIVSYDPIQAYFDANEQAYLKYRRLDQQNERPDSRDAATPVFMSLADEEGYPHQGYIDFVDNRVNQSTGSMRARAIFPNRDQFLTPGVFVRIQVPASKPQPRILVPDVAVGTDQDKQFVWIVDGANKAQRQVVKTGPMAKGLRVIEEGLTGEESVVIRGVQRCRAGAEVQPTVEEIEPGDGLGLPDDYSPVAREEWLLPPTPPAPQPQAPGRDGASAPGAAG
ncbi:efflux RND transporter periplasmic adaptor subunit [Botrimarina sp.]|uniref:efflux RND transporter periplasmic adaptor subunit n=1 Tax=Botrimarina sp. TaxID=2795802 RepID=UPI0032EDA3DC